MRNALIAAQFEQLADLLEIQGANAFRVRAYRNAVHAIELLTTELCDLLADGVDLQTLDGIGKDLAEKIGQLVRTGNLPQLQELLTEIPAGVLDLLRVPGLGPKKVAVLFRELQIRSLADLRGAAEAGQIATLKGFGAKTQQAILDGLAVAEAAQERVLLSTATAVAQAIVGDLRFSGVILQAEVAGSCRRRKETICDLDVLAMAEDHAAAMQALADNPLVSKVLQRGETKQRVRLYNGMELDLRVVPAESFGAALQYFTGSKEHNVELRGRAKELGLKVNEYGVYRGEDRIAGASEQEVYAALGLDWIPPELREGRGEIERAARHALPRLVEVGDICGDLHMHTTATDGVGTIREMAEAAKARGLKYIAITDHSKRVAMANGLDEQRLRAHWRAIEKVRGEISGIEILKGIECDILEDATMDLPDDVLAEADWVIAVLHYGLRQPREQIQQRLLHAIRHPAVDAIGHPTGRMLNGRAGADVDLPEFLRAAADFGVMLEINANPSRLDLCDLHAAAAAELGIPIIIDTDSHATNGFEVLPFGVDQARRAGLTKAQIANCDDWLAFEKRLRPRK